MLLSMLAIAGIALVGIALLLHLARNATRRRRSLKNAELIRLRLQDEPSGHRILYREIPIRLNGN
jgi:hypothetical protein